MHRARSKYGIEQGDRVRHFIPADLVDAELSDRKDTIERALKSFFWQVTLGMTWIALRISLHLVVCDSA